MSRKDRFKAKDKITHKMTRNGLVEINETQDEQRRVSQRGQDFNLQERRQDTSAGDTRQASGNSAPAPVRGRQPQAPQSVERAPEAGYQPDNSQRDTPRQPAETSPQVGNRFELGPGAPQADSPFISLSTCS